MTIGLQAIAALIRDGHRPTFRRLRDFDFLPDELPAWQFLCDYYGRHGAFPTAEVFRENGLRLARPTGELGYHVDMVHRRTVYNAIQQSHGPLIDALQARNINAAVDAMNEMQAAVARVRMDSSAATMAEWAGRIREAYDEQRRQPEQEGITLGYAPLDNLTGGMFPGDVVAIVARPNIGKSYTISHMALHAWRAGYRPLLITNEMSDAQIAYRLAGISSRVDPKYIRRGQVSHWTWPQVDAALREFAAGEMPRFDLVGGDMRKSAQDVDALIQEIQPDAVYIDASYLMRPSTSARNKSRWELLADVGEDLKAVALARNVPLVHTVQFSRQQRARARVRDGDPTQGMDLANIGGTDVIGQVASIVIGIREGKPPNQWTRRRYAVIKNREGPLGTFTTKWLFSPIDFEVAQDETNEETSREENARRQERAMQQMAESDI